MEKISRERFIRLGTVLGVGAACASLVACGGGASGSGGGGDSGGGNSGGGGNYGGGGSGGGRSNGGRSNGGSSNGGSSNGGSSNDGSQKSSGGDAQAGGAAIASESEVAPGSAFKFKDSGNPAVLIHLKSGDFVAYSAVCTHQGCTVGYRGGKLACPCHGSVFDPARGAEVVAGPAPSPLPEIPVKVEGSEIVKA